MLPAPALCRVATPCSRTEPSPRTSPPQRPDSSASVYPAAGISSVAALGVPAGGLIVLLHLLQHLVSDVHAAVGIHTVAEDHVVFLRLGEFLHGLERILLQGAERGVTRHRRIILEVGRLAAEVALQVIDLALRVLHLRG